MTRTGRTLTEYMEMGAAGIAALVSFSVHLPPDSATWRETHPREADMAMWATTAKTNAILADLFDAYAISHTRKGRPKPKPYPRPGVDRGRSIGSGAIRIRDFDAWWKSGK